MNTLPYLGTLVAGLAVGAFATFAYEHYLGDGSALARAQADLADVTANLSKAKDSEQHFKSETDAESDQIQQLTLAKADLKKQVDDLKSAAPAAPAPAASNPIAALVSEQLKSHNDEQLQLLETRLHLTPDQVAAVKAVLDAEAKRTSDMTSSMFSGGKIDPTALAAAAKGKTLDQTLNDILTPEQKTAYQQMQSDQKDSRSESMASSEVNQIAPLLQLNDAQKDQAYTAIYQADANMQNPDWIKNNVTMTPGDPFAALDAAAKAKEDALAKILTPDQLAAYHQQAQTQLQSQKSIMQKFMPAATPPAPPAVPQ